MNFLSLTAVMRNSATNETKKVPLTINASHIVVFEESTQVEGGASLTLDIGIQIHVQQSARDIAQKLGAH